MKRIFILLVILSVIVLSGCGTKGPLYLPDKEHPQKQDKSKER